MSFVNNIFGLVDSIFETAYEPPNLLSWSEAASGKTNVELNADSSITVNGIVIPRLVAEQLKNAGIPIAFLSAGQLEAAILACAVDCRLIDDPNGGDFFDDLQLDADDLEMESECKQQALAKEHANEEEGPEEDELHQDSLMNAGHASAFAVLSGTTGSVYANAGGFRQKIKEEREQARERKKNGSHKDADGTEKSSPMLGA